jgi:hypothetical protein
MADGKGKMMREAIMKRRTELIVIGVVALAAAVFAMKRGGKSEAGCTGGGACCPWMSGMNLWPTNPWTGTNVAKTNPAVTGSESITNRLP